MKTLARARGRVTSIAEVADSMSIGPRRRRITLSVTSTNFTCGIFAGGVSKPAGYTGTVVLEGQAEEFGPVAIGDCYDLTMGGLSL